MSLKTTRRSFLKGVCATGAAGALGTALGLNHRSVFAATAQAEPAVKEYKGLCLMCKHSGCSNIITTEDGVITSIKGNPDQPANKGSLCARGKSTIYHTYNPYRVKAPMKRTNPEKGMDVDPGWMEITWAEALDTVAGKLQAVLKDNPNKLLIFTGFGMSELTMNGLMSGARFPAAFGTVNTTTTKGEFCAIHYGGYVVLANGPTANSDNAHCDYQVMIGRGAGINPSYANGDARGLVNCMKENAHGKPMKLVCIDPVDSVEASMGEWIKMKPGADLPFIMAMTKVMLDDDKYDKEFLKTRTNAPYLIIKGTNNPRMDGHYARGANGAPLMWNGSEVIEVDENTRNFPGELEVTTDITLPEGSQLNYMPLGTGVRNMTALPAGTRAEPAFMAFKRAYDGWTPEKAAAICNIPAASITKIARDFVTAARGGADTDEYKNFDFKFKDHDGSEKVWNTRYRPVSLICSRGISNHEDGSITDVATKLINVLVGNIYVPGGLQGTGLGSRTGTSAPGGFDQKDWTLNHSGEGAPYGVSGKTFTWPPTFMDLYGVFPHRHSTNTICMQVALEGPKKWGFQYEPEVLFVAGGNPILANGSPDMCVEAIKKMYTINIAYHLDEITQMSDILLVSPSMLETFGHVDYMGTECSMSNGEPGFPTDQTNRLFRDPVPSLYNTQEPNQTVLDLAWRIGIGPELNSRLNEGFLRPPVQQTIGASSYAMDKAQTYSYEEILDRAYKAAYGDPIVNPQSGETEPGGLAYMKKHSYLKTYSGGSNALNEGELYAEYWMDTTDRRIRYNFYLHTQMESGEYLFDMVNRKIVNDEDGILAGVPGAKRTFKDYLGVEEDYLQNYFDPVIKCITEETKIFNPTDSSYRLFAVPHRLPASFFRIGAVDQNPWLLDWNNKFNPYYNSVVIHPDEAAKHNPVLQEGEIVTVQSSYVEPQLDTGYNPITDDRGNPIMTERIYQTKGKVHITKTVHPDACVIPGALGRINKTLGTATSDQVCLNKLLNGKLGYINPIHGGLETSTRVKIFRAL